MGWSLQGPCCLPEGSQSYPAFSMCPRVSQSLFMYLSQDTNVWDVAFAHRGRYARYPCVYLQVHERNLALELVHNQEKTNCLFCSFFVRTGILTTDQLSPKTQQQRKNSQTLLKCLQMSTLQAQVTAALIRKDKVLPACREEIKKSSFVKSRWCF